MNKYTKKIFKFNYLFVIDLVEVRLGPVELIGVIAAAAAAARGTNLLVDGLVNVLLFIFFPLVLVVNISVVSRALG